LRLFLHEPPAGGAPHEVRLLDVRPFDFSRSLADFFHAVAACEPRGHHPRWLHREQSYWTPAGIAGGTIAAVLNEEGLLEPDRGSPSLEPFLYADGKLMTWADAQVSVSTGAGQRGAAMAAAASLAGADRIFLMGYDYHYAGSDVGASAPLDRRDGAEQDLPWSLDLYESVGVPVEKTILGLPLYGMRWRVEGPELGASRLGDGAIWVPADNPKFLADPPAPPELDPIEIVEFYSVAPTVSPEPGDSRATAGWQAIYVDSPQTLEPKMVLADDRGLAGAGFWAIGYERGITAYTDLMTRFAKGGLQ